MPTKGQLILKCPLGVFKSSEKTTKFFPGFLPKPIKKGQIKKIKTIYTTNWRILFWLSYTTFLIWPLYRLGQKSWKKFRWIFGRSFNTKRTFWNYLTFSSWPMFSQLHYWGLANKDACFYDYRKVLIQGINRTNNNYCAEFRFIIFNSFLAPLWLHFQETWWL